MLTLIELPFDSLFLKVLRNKESVIQNRLYKLLQVYNLLHYYYLEAAKARGPDLVLNTDYLHELKRPEKTQKKFTRSEKIKFEK